MRTVWRFVPAQAGLAAAAGWLAVLAAQGATAQSPDLAAIPAENPSSVPEHLCAVDGTLYFVADDGIHGREIWAYRPAAGPEEPPRCALLADLRPGPESSQPWGLLDGGGRLYFTAEIESRGRRPWLWDPGEGKARMLVNPGRDMNLQTPRFLCVAGGHVYFSGTTVGRSRALYATEPGNAVVRLLSALPIVAERVRFAAGGDGTLFFYRGEGLARTDGTKAGTHLVCAIPEIGNLFVSGAVQVLPWGAVLVGREDEHGSEPWLVDDSPRGPRLLKDIAPGDGSSNSGGFFQHGGLLYFFANDGEHGEELWRSDGTDEGTSLVKDIFEGEPGCNPHHDYVASVGQRLYFLADDGNGRELWRTDGTPENTRMVEDLYAGVRGAEPWRLTEYKGALFFCANSSVYGEEVFVTDETTEGARVLKDIVPGPGGSGPHQLTVFGDWLFFTCDDGVHGEELWMTDGTREGTRLAADIYPFRFNPPSSPRSLTALGRNVFFVISDWEHGEEVWVSDGTAEGTTLLCDIAAGPADARPRGLTPVAGRMFFVAADTDERPDLWCSDGTPVGTYRLRDRAPHLQDGDPQCLYAGDGALYFIAGHGAAGREIWRSDGTREGTKALEALQSVPEGAAIVDIFALPTGVHFRTAESTGVHSLWRVDEMGNTQLIAESLPDTASDVPDGGGTPDSEALLLAQFLRPQAGSPRETAPVTLGDATFFVRHTMGHGAELWRTDGTHAGTRRVCDAYPGPPSSSPTHLTPVGNTLYFAAEHPLHGRVLWHSHGTESGTACVSLRTDNGEVFVLPAVSLACVNQRLVMCSLPAVAPETQPENAELRVLAHEGRRERQSDALLNIRAGPEGSWPRQFTPAGDRLFFTADDGVHGEELWATDGTLEGTYLVKDILTPGDLSPRGG